jgi:predicted AAA+ superfamily ATPase
LGKRIVKTPKVYFRDSGLLCFLLGLDERSLPASSQLGAVWETFIFSEMRKVNDTLERPKRFWFYRDQEAAEVDFLIESGGRLSMAEAKWTESPNASDIRSMEKLSKRMMDLALATKPGNCWVISRCPAAHSLSVASRCLNPLGIREMLEA